MTCGDGLLQDVAGGLVVTMSSVRAAQSGECLRGNVRVRRRDRLVKMRHGTVVIFEDDPSVLGQADQGAVVPGVGGALERRPGQFRLVPPQQVTKFSKGLAVTAIKLLAVVPAEHLSRRSRQAGIGSQQIPDAGLQRLLGFPAARAADHRRQWRRDAGICFCADENQPGQFAAYSPRPGRAWAGVSQHLIAVCPDRLHDEPRRQIHPGHPASCPRIRLTTTFLISHNPQNTMRVTAP